MPIHIVQPSMTLTLKRGDGINATVSSCKKMYDLFIFTAGLTQRFPRGLVTSSNNPIGINGLQSDNTKAIGASNNQAGADIQANKHDKGQNHIAASYAKLNMCTYRAKKINRNLKTTLFINQC